LRLAVLKQFLNSHEFREKLKGLQSVYQYSSTQKQGGGENLGKGGKGGRKAGWPSKKTGHPSGKGRDNA